MAKVAFVRPNKTANQTKRRTLAAWHSALLTMFDLSWGQSPKSVPASCWSIAVIFENWSAVLHVTPVGYEIIVIFVFTPSLHEHQSAMHQLSMLLFHCFEQNGSVRQEHGKQQVSIGYFYLQIYGSDLHALHRCYCLNKTWDQWSVLGMQKADPLHHWLIGWFFKN